MQGTSLRSTMQARGGACFVAAGDSLYVVGGFNGSELGDMHAFDTAAGSWKQLDASSAQRQLPPRSVAGIVATPSPGQLLPGSSRQWSSCAATAWLTASQRQAAAASSGRHLCHDHR
jgi:Galactose oxidase, central domain